MHSFAYGHFQGQEKPHWSPWSKGTLQGLGRAQESLTLSGSTSS